MIIFNILKSNYTIQFYDLQSFKLDIHSSHSNYMQKKKINTNILDSISNSNINLDTKSHAPTIRS